MIRLEPNPIPILDHWLGRLDKTLAKAASDALNDTAKDARARLVSTLKTYFTIRNKWVQKGFRIVWSNPKTLTALVGHLDEYMRIQATGGRKHARAGGSVAIPYAARKKKTALTPPQTWPSQILKRRRGAFLANGIVGVSKSTRRKRGVSGPSLASGAFTTKTVWFWSLRKFVVVRKTWDIEGEVRTAQQASFPQHLAKRIEQMRARVRPNGSN